MEFKILETKDLILKPFQTLNKDEKERLVKEIVENANEEDILNNTRIIELLKKEKIKTYNAEFATKFVNNKNEDSIEIAIYNKEDEFVGMTGISDIDEYNKNCSMGYWISKNQRRKGYITQAAKKVIEFAFKELKLHKINVSAFSYNEGSNKVLEKQGFRLVGTKKENVYRYNKYYDENIYELLSEDYFKLSNS